MTEQINVDLEDRSYAIQVGTNLLGSLDKVCKDVELGLVLMLIGVAVFGLW